MNDNKTCLCGADIMWRRTARGEMMPIDRAPSSDGNIKFAIDREGVYRAVVLGESARALAVASGDKLHKSHVATCPLAAPFRSGKRPSARRQQTPPSEEP